MASYRKLNNKWSVVFDMPTNNEKRLQKRLSGYNSRREAELAYIAYKGENKHIKPLGQGIAFKAAYDKYLSYKKDRIKESSWITIDDKFRLHIIPYFEDKIITEITSDDCLDWQDWLKNKINKNRKLSPASINDIHTILSTFFRHCIDFDLIEKNPLQKIKKLRDARRRVEMHIWTEEQFKLFIEQISDIEYKTLYYTLYLTGLRIGEALALKWTSLTGNELNVNASLTKKTRDKTDLGRKKIQETKYISSDRIILIPQTLIEKLEALKKYYKEFSGFSENNFIFGNLEPLPHQTVKNRKDTACKAAGVPQIRIHDFRHSHASYLIACGADIVTIAQRLGHKDIKETLNTYAHLMPNKQENMLNLLNNI